MELLSRAKELAGDLIEIRRDIHAHPELSFRETRTAELIADKLKSLGYEVRTQVGVTGCIGELGSGDGRTVALRADMDALPIQEANDVPYRSQVDGVMHACGHDAHVACLLGAAMLLAESERSGDLPPGRVRLLFQPSEETTDEHNLSGARRMIEDGAMEGVDAVVGLHVAAESPAREVLFRAGPLMAGNDTLSGTVRGTSAHAALPHEGKDALLFAAHVVLAVQAIVARNVDPLEPAVVTFGTIEGGTASNILCSEVRLGGTLRYFGSEVRRTLHEELKRAFAVADAMGGEGEIEIRPGYPPLTNDARLTEIVSAAARSVVGDDDVVTADLIMGAEDFAFLAREAPGCFFWLGAGIEGDGRAHHSPRFDIDESCLPRGAAVLAAAAGKVLAEW
ncbi:MAG: amidohydrolase [Gemmatimonadetes bacterium]|nr:amidohydrolase [Gemmatimonadota bacterium]NIO32050.1 amidohydrolase [Gemmatimonadota bacterium]